MTTQLSRKDAAALIGISPAQLGRYLARGLLTETAEGLPLEAVLAFRGPQAWTELLLPHAAAALLQVSVATLHLYRRQGRVTPAFTTPTGRHLYRKADLEALAPNSQDALTGIEAARYLGRSLSTLKDYADKGLIAVERTPAGRRRYPKASLDAYLAQH